MNMSARLTLDGLVRALRWKGLRQADLHQTREQMAGQAEAVGLAQAKIAVSAPKGREP